MPFYDRACAGCGWQAIDLWEACEAPPLPCPTCGQLTDRAWLTKPPAEIGDECDFVQRNGTKTPIRFRSKLEFRRWCKEHNYRVQDTHVGEQGSDKSKHTTAWQAGGTQWLRDAEILATRQGNFAGNEPPEKPFHIRWTSGEMTGKDLAHYRDQST